MSAITPQTPRTTSNRSRLAKRPVWQVGIAAAVAGAVVTELFAAGARAIGVPLQVAAPGSDTAETIKVLGFGTGVLIWSAVGIVLAVVLARWARRPARAFTVTTVVLTVISLGGPAMAEQATTATQVVLALSHLVAAAVVIPVLAYRLSHVTPRC